MCFTGIASLTAVCDWWHPIIFMQGYSVAIITWHSSLFTLLITLQHSNLPLMCCIVSTADLTKIRCLRLLRWIGSPAAHIILEPFSPNLPLTICSKWSAVHQDQNFTPQKQFLPIYSWPHQQGINKFWPAVNWMTWRPSNQSGATLMHSGQSSRSQTTLLNLRDVIGRT